MRTSETPSLDGQVLLSHVVGRSRAWVLAHPEAQLSASQMADLRSKLERLEGGEPLPYVIGHWEFYGLDFKVTPDTLIPRPETELLIETALGWLRRRPGKRQVVDLGTGTGCIAISLAVHLPDLQVTATDFSLPTLEIAQDNAEQHNVSGRVRFIQADLFPPKAERFDLICANLPYIPSGELARLEIYGREPSLALDGGPSGLGVIRRLIETAPERLLPGGLILIEIEATQGRTAIALAQAVFHNAEIQVLPDLAGRDRLLTIQTTGADDSPSAQSSPSNRYLP